MDGEVLVGPERRRRWSAQEKSAFVEASLRPGARISDLTRRHGISRSLLYKWRREALGGAAVVAKPGQPSFVPVVLTPAPSAVASLDIHATKPAPRDPNEPVQRGEIEVALAGGTRVTLRGPVEPNALRAVLAALKA